MCFKRNKREARSTRRNNRSSRLFSGRESTGNAKDVDRAKLVRERQNEERQRKLEELRQQAFAAQRFREQREEERRRRIDELRSRDNDRFVLLIFSSHFSSFSLPRRELLLAAVRYNRVTRVQRYVKIRENEVKVRLERTLGLENSRKRRERLIRLKERERKLLKFRLKLGYLIGGKTITSP